MNASQSQQNEKGNKASKSNPDRKTLDSQNVGNDEYDVIVRHKQDNKKFFCKLCYQNNSRHYSGQWHNRNDHLATQTHRKAQEKEKALQNDGDIDCKSQDEKQDNEIKEPAMNYTINTLTPEIKSELDL